MSRRDDYIAAASAGRNASPGDVNPFAGQGILADLWRGGYNAMLAARVAAVKPETPRP